jgi:nucleotide-binding universal stress UspA family protein
VDVVTVINPKTSEEDRGKYLEYLGKQRELLVSHGLKDVTTSLVDGDVVSAALLQHAENNGHEMIWMETHGRTGISSLLMSSITEEVVANAKVPVLSLRPERPEGHHWYYHDNLPI